MAQNTSPNADLINKNIRGLSYNPQEILAFSGDRISSFVPRTASQTPDKFIVVTKTKHQLSGSFDIAVPNARKDITYPGALLLANQKLIEGVPDPLVVDLAPREITIDLPGLTDDNSELVEKYNFAGVSAATNKLINNWLETKAKKFTIAANTEFKKNILYNESSMALSFGVDVSYMKDKLGINFDAITKQESSAYLVQFRQIFYTVSAELPKNPADVFGPGVTWDDLKVKINEQNPPAYVQNVQYGREVYLLLTSNMSSTELKGHLDATLEFNNGTVSTNNDVQTKSLNKAINCTVITIGGKPVVINGNLDTDNILQQVNELITQNVEFTEQNPPLPLAYTVAFLKDNKIASIQGTTEYITTDSQVFTSGIIELQHNAGFVGQFNVSWDEVTYSGTGKAIVNNHLWEGNGINRTLGFTASIPVPPNAKNIRVIIMDFSGLAWDPVFILMDQRFNLIAKRRFTISGTTLNPYVDVSPQDVGLEGPSTDDKSVEFEGDLNFDLSGIGGQPSAANGGANGGRPTLMGGVPTMNMGERGSWYRFDSNFTYKTMKYQNSCFPCSVTTVLANLGYIPASGSPIEDEWDKFHGGLDKSAPNALQIHEYLSKTFELGKKGVVYTPLDFTTADDAEIVRQRIMADFLMAKGPVGLVAGVGHAEVFYKTKEGRFLHFRPAPERDAIDCEYVLITELKVLKGGKSDYAIGIEYTCNDAEEARAAHFAMIIS